MLTPKSRNWPIIAAFCHQPWSPSPALASRLSPRELVEEEKTPYYSPERFYPASLGQTLDNRYQLATKLGYGSGSTVWLARDLYRCRWLNERYVAIKINAKDHHSRKDAAKSELAILQHISRKHSHHEGWHFVRKLVDSFVLDSGAGSHICLVFEPLREPLWLYCRRFVDGVIPSDVLKVILQMALQGLDYLHTECQVIHADLKPDNIMVKLEDPEILERDVRDEYDHPLPQKVLDGRTIYLSRNNYGRPLKPTGIVQITDFGLSVRGHLSHSGCIQAELYRAPEVVLDAGYTYSADIWSLGVMLWDLLQGEKLFDDLIDPTTGEYDDQRHLAQITSLLGKAPDDLLRRGRRTSMFYETDGNLKNSSLVSPNFSFEGTIDVIAGEDKTMFIEFVKRMLRWRPEERPMAKELLKDPWLDADYSQ